MKSDTGDAEHLSECVIYKNPRDYPGQYVLRRQLPGRGVVIPDKDPLYVGWSLLEARWSMPPGLFRMPSGTETDPAIFEVWV